MEQKRDYRMDLLRIVACFMVIVIHVSSYNFTILPVKSMSWQIHNIYDSMVRAAVPIFIMISGAFLLNKDISIKDILKKYVFKMLVIYIIWSFIYALYNFYMQYKCINSMHDIVIIIKYTIGSAFHLWYLPMLCFLYLITPFLRKITKDKDEKLLYYGLVIFIALAILQTLAKMSFLPKYHILVQIINKFQSGFFLQFYSYYILGFYLYHSDKMKQKRFYYYVLAIAGVVACILCNSYISIKAEKASDVFYDGFVIFTVLEAIGLFLFFKYSKCIGWIADKCYNIIKIMAPCTLGIYLVHILVLNYTSFIISKYNKLISIPMCCIVTFLISFVIIFILQKIKKIFNDIIKRMKKNTYSINKKITKDIKK